MDNLIKVDSNPSYRLKFLRGERKDHNKEKFDKELEKYIALEKEKTRKRKNFFIGGLESGLNSFNFICEFPYFPIIGNYGNSKIRAEYHDYNNKTNSQNYDFISSRLYEIGYTAGLITSPLFLAFRSFPNSYKILFSKE